MYKVGVCEDDPKDLQDLERLLKNFLEYKGIRYRVEAESNPQAFAKNYYAGKYDVVFLDIYLGTRTGIEVAKKIRMKDPNVLIIFITSSYQHAIESYEVRAFHYLVKPVEQTKFNQCMEECIKNKDMEPEGILFKIGGKSELVPFNSIEFMESEGHRVIVHTTVGDLIVREKLDAIEQRLNQDCFIRTKQSFLVNMSFIVSIESNKITMKSGAITTIRHANIKEIKRLYTRYLLDQAM